MMTYDTSRERAIARAAADQAVDDRPPGLRRFHRGLELLQELTGYHLFKAGIIASAFEGARFDNDPFVWFIHAGPAPQAAVWALVEARLPPEPQDVGIGGTGAASAKAA